MKIGLMYDKTGWIVDKMTEEVIKHAPKDCEFAKFDVDITYE